MQNNDCYYIKIKSNQESDGRLLVVENNTMQVPFDIQRIFWIRDIKQGAMRGNHANKKTNIVLIAISGSCDVVVNNGKEEVTYHLDSPEKGLYIKSMLWRTIKNSSTDCILEAVCDRKYSATDETFDDFDEYLRELNSIKSEHL